MSSKSNASKREVRIKAVPAYLVTQLENIAKKIGSDKSDFLKTKLDEIAQQYPEHYRNYSPEDV